MPRRFRPAKRKIDPDPKYGNVQLASFINRVMKHGKKSTARKIIYDALELIQEKTQKDGLEVFQAALKEISPLMEVRPRRVGGATYQVPMEVPPERRFALATRWLIAATRARSGNSFAEKLAGELIDASTGQGASVRKREESHRMAEANRAFSHFRI